MIIHNNQAKKNLYIKKYPSVFILHLKRFKYFENLNGYKKLPYRVSFPFELKLNGMEINKIYKLYSIVIHQGSEGILILFKV
jgi:ubiquitin C-terminal hydrolase